MTTSLPLDAIRVGERHRLDMGDVDSLAESIRRIGLLHPIVVTPDHRLIAGGRRLAACDQLGWAEIPVRVVANLTDARALLEAERDENTCRKEMAASEAVSLGKALEALERPKAEARQQAAGPASVAKREGRDDGRENFTPPSAGKTRDIVGAAVGMSGPTYQKAKAVVATGTPELVRAMDEGAASIQSAADVATLPPDRQREIVAKGETEILAAAKEIRLEKALARLPEDERDPARVLVVQSGIPTSKAVEMVTNLTAKPTEERVRIYSLGTSTKPHERDLALTEAANMPPMPHPAIQSLNMAMQYLRDAHKRAEGEARDTLAEMIRLGRQVVDQSRTAA